VAAYRGGYLPEERRQIETGLRRGDLLAVVATNALELGIDIPSLDAVVMAGWPSTRASFWQQAGRAGRGSSDGLAILIAAANPFDAFIVENPHVLFDEPLEANIFDPFNPYVLAPHICAAAEEHPLTDADIALFSESMVSLVEQLVQRGVLRKRVNGWFWVADFSAAALTSLRSDGGSLRLIDGASGAVIGEMDFAKRFTHAHPGAVYVHQGKTFRVTDMDENDHVALLSEDQLNYRTVANSSMALSVTSVSEEKLMPSGVGWHHGSVDITTKVTSYTRLAMPDLDRIDTVPLDFPSETMSTHASWWTLPDEIVSSLSLKADELAGGLHGAEHAMIGMLPLLATCDRWDLGGLSTPLHSDTGLPTVFVHDAAGGVGFAARGYEQHRMWMTTTAQVLRDCPCESGCPGCIQSPKCGNGNQVLNKAAALALLEAAVAGT
jgi:DEAD/DEAH box helicase domain-containing protein